MYIKMKFIKEMVADKKKGGRLVGNDSRFDKFLYETTETFGTPFFQIKKHQDCNYFKN